MRRFNLRWLNVMLMSVLLAGVAAPPARAAAWAAGQPVPSSTDGALAGPQPTLQFDPAQGYAGQRVSVSGFGLAGYPQVRVAWWVGEATRTAALAPVQADLSYQAELSVPPDAAPGPAQICAGVAGAGPDSALAEFACLPFTILAPPAASLTGSIPVTAGRAPRAISASLVLIDPDGYPVASAPIAQDGSFSFASLAPGSYTAGVEGELPVLVEPQGLTLAPGASMALDLTPATWAACAVMPSAAVTDILVTPGVKALSAPGSPKTVGTYLSLSALGPVVTLSLQALLQTVSGVSVQRVEFWLERPDGFTFKVAQDSSAPYQFNYNASLLMPGKTKITARVIMVDGSCTKSRDIYLAAMAHPFNSPALRNASVSWNAAMARYEFSADIPNLPGTLPARYPDPPPSIPLVGTLVNEFDAWQHFEGYLYLNRGISLSLMQYHADARVISQSILNKSETWWNSEHPIGAVGGSQVPKMYFGPSTLIQINKQFPVYSGPLWTFAGIVTVNASVKVGFYGDIILQGTLEPWTPAASMRLMPNVSPYLPVSIWLDLLLLIGKVGITGTTTLNFGLPLEVSTKTSPPAYFDDPCISLKIVLEGWAEIYYYFDTAHWDLFDFEVLDRSWGSCAAQSRAALQAARGPWQVQELRTLPAPEVASSGAHMGMVYVEDTTPGEAFTTPVVMARFYDPDLNGWGAAVPVSQPGFFVKDPVIAFAGSGGEALVAWSQNTLTRAEGANLRQDVSAIFAQQEIFYSFWNGSAWSAPQALTDDDLADGSAAIAGDSAGGATLAWVVDTDGDLTTRNDAEIATAEWNGAWGPVSLLGLQAPDDTALDAQVRVIRPASRTLTSLLVWTRDEDADLTTNSDRTLVLGRLSGGVWSTEALWDLPLGLDSPTAAWDESNQTLHLAFLLRGKDEDGLTDTGLGNMGQLWVARWDAGGGWSATVPVLHDGQAVYAERPQLLSAPGQDTSLLFRRFDEPGTPGETGALALSQLREGYDNFSAPLYLKPAASTNWMQAATAYNASNLVLVSLNRPAELPGQAGATPGGADLPAAAGVETWRLSLAGTAEALETSLILYAPDPALDAGLEITPLHAGAGTPLAIEATLRNLGREPAANLTVELYAGVPGSGTLLDTQAVAGPLAFGESLAVAFEAVSSGEAQPFYVRVTTAGTDLNPSNNLAQGDAGFLPPPTGLNAQPGAGPGSSLLLSWMPPGVPGVQGYRLLRSETPAGPYELVGLSLGTFFEDLDVARGVDFYYVVQAYDAAGNWSAYSPVATGKSPRIALYLPVLR